MQKNPIGTANVVMMEGVIIIMKIKPIQNLQDAYSSVIGLTIMITDNDNKLLTKPSGLIEIVSLLLEYPKKIVEDSIEGILGKVNGIQQAIVYETLTGFKVLVVPIKIRKKIVYYLLAGVLIDESVKILIKSKISGKVQEHEWATWERALNSTPSYVHEQIGCTLNKLEELAEMVELFLEREEEKAKYAQRVQLLNLVHLMDSGDPNWLQGVLGVFTRVMDFEFAGFASKQSKGEQYTVINTVGFKGNATLQGATFFNGEGFLGQVGLTKQMGYWEKSDQDPRISFFTKRGIKAKVIICYPIKYEDHFFGLLFGGDTSTPDLSEEQADMGALLANKLSIDFYCSANKASNERRQIQMSAFKEMTLGILDIKDKDAFIQMLIEILERTIAVTSTCLLLEKKGQKTKDIYTSSSSTLAFSSAYVQNLELTYFGKESRSISMVHKPIYRNWNGLEMIEFPLVLEQKLLGVLGVYCGGGSIDEENMPLIRAMNTIVVTRMQLEAQVQVPSSSTSIDIATLLHQVLLEWNPQAYYKALRVKELTQGFLKQLEGSLEDITWIGQVSLLSAYEPEVLSSSIGEISAVSMLREVRRYRMNETKNESIEIESYPLVKKVLYMVVWYYEFGDREWYTKLPFSLEEPLRQSFELFLSTQTERIVKPLVETKERLTPREEEVLNHILQGKNNSEISETLHISSHTVKNHITKVYGKMRVSSRGQAIAKVYQTSLTEPTKKR